MGKGCCEGIHYPSGYMNQGLLLLLDTLGLLFPCTILIVLVLLQRIRFISIILHYYISGQCCFLKHLVV